MGEVLKLWLVAHPILAAILCSACMSVVVTGIYAILQYSFRRKSRYQDRHGVYNAAAVRDMIRGHTHDSIEQLEDDFRGWDARNSQQMAQTNRVLQSQQRSIQTLQRAVLALQKKAKAESKPTPKPRGKKAQKPQDAWDHILQDDDPDAGPQG